MKDREEAFTLAQIKYLDYLIKKKREASGYIMHLYLYLAVVSFFFIWVSYNGE